MELTKSTNVETRWSIRNAKGSSLKIIDIASDNLSSLDNDFQDFQALMINLVSRGNIFIALNIPNLVLITSDYIDLLSKCSHTCWLRGGKLILIGAKPHISRLFSVNDKNKYITMVKNESYATLHT